MCRNYILQILTISDYYRKFAVLSMMQQQSQLSDEGTRISKFSASIIPAFTRVQSKYDDVVNERETYGG